MTEHLVQSLGILPIFIFSLFRFPFFIVRVAFPDFLF